MFSKAKHKYKGFCFEGLIHVCVSNRLPRILDGRHAAAASLLHSYSQSGGELQEGFAGWDMCAAEWEVDSWTSQLEGSVCVKERERERDLK